MNKYKNNPCFRIKAKTKDNRINTISVALYKQRTSRDKEQKKK